VDGAGEEQLPPAVDHECRHSYVMTMPSLIRSYTYVSPAATVTKTTIIASGRVLDDRTVDQAGGPFAIKFIQKR
jgi:hypothetical protein